MSFNWNKVGEKISVLYQEMDFHSEYNIEQLEYDVLKILRTPAEQLQNSGSLPEKKIHHSKWLPQLRESLERHRSILTKLFSFTNNRNGVDTLIEYCDRYIPHYNGQRINNIPIELPEHPNWIPCTAFLMLATNEATGRVLDYAWRALISFDADLSQRVKYSRFDDPTAMVIMADADLNAAVQALIRSRRTCFKISRVFVQEPVKKQLLDKMKNYEYKDEILPNLYVFRYATEAIGNLNGRNKLDTISIWSENIIGAKKFSSNVESGTVWINTHGVIAASLYSLLYQSHREPLYLWATFCVDTDGKSPILPIENSKTYDLFYGGKWQIPTDRKYWTNPDGNSFALATEKDVINCVDDARKAFKLWRSKKLSQRLKIVRSFADRLRANSQSEFADLILQTIEQALEFYTTFSIVRDGEAEISSTSEPVGVALILAQSFNILFAKVITAVVTGNAVIILSNSNKYISFTPYCDMLGSCGFLPGVVSSLFINNPKVVEIIEGIVDTKLLILEESPFLEDNSDSYGISAARYIIYKKIFNYVTKPKCVWLQCD